MARLSLLIFMILLQARVFAQGSTYWLQAAGSPNVDENLALCSDNLNNVVAAGYFVNTLTFPNGTSLTSTSAGISDAFVQKTDAQGQVLWKVKAGGMGSDRATAVACDGQGNVYVAGHFYGSATIGSTTLTSVSNSKDIFIAKISASGTFVWATSAGGPLAEDVFAIHVDDQGNVLITGEFQGSSTFGTQTITSMLNISGSPSFDVFIAKYDNAGNFQWVRQGAAEFNDRGLDIGADASGNVFVCGQFSDTITFNQVHNNQVNNAVFIIKYSPSGQELWFARAGATSSIAYGLVVDNNNDVYVTGDYTGTLVFYGTPNNSLFGSYTNRIFLVKYSNSGIYLWGAEDASNSYVSARDVALNPAGDPCIYGEFECRMDEYSVAAGGSGTFNSIGYKDLFICQYDKNGTRQWMRNWGGQNDDKAHGIAFTNTSVPYTAGSYENRILFNSSYASCSVLGPPLSGTIWVSVANCNNLDVYYYGTSSYGASDCFILHAVDNTCPYYDYYYRSGVGCQLDFVEGCIDNYTYTCPDTIQMCSGSIGANPYTGVIGMAGPLYHFLWNTGDTLQTHTVSSSGYYSCVMTTFDGCFTSEDTVYAQLNPTPQPPTITDNLGININQPPATYSINICGGTVTLTGGNLQNCTYVWTGPGIVSTSGASCVVNQSGWYTFTITNAFGCSNANGVYVKIDVLDHVVPVTNEPDTFTTCGCFTYFIYDSLTNPGASSYLAFQSLTTVITGNGQVIGFPYSLWDNLSVDICPAATGWINLNIAYIFSSTCGSDTAYFNKSIYVILIPTPPPPQILINIDGNLEVCPGDSTLLTATFTVTPNTASYTVSPVDSMWTQAGQQFCFGVIATDSSSGCPSSSSGWSCVAPTTKANPYIYAIPSNKIICPGDSVQLVCQWPGGVSWQWYGPSGVMPSGSQSIYAGNAGFYYCIATDSNGCSLTSNTIELQMYNTPYLMGLPSTIACAGQTVTLQVVSNDTSAIQWLAPLSGNSTTQQVTAGGTYSCQVTACGITTICTINVITSNPSVQINAIGSLTMCPGDSVLLAATSGMASYFWLPTSEVTDSIYAYTAGVYTVIVTDAYGCQATDTIAVVSDPSAPPPPTAAGDSICAGDSAFLQAFSTGNYVFDWYTQTVSGSLIHTGATFTTPPLFTNSTYYVSIKDSTGCHSVRTPVYVNIIPTSLPPVIWGDSIVCGGDTLHLYASPVPGAVYSWGGPGGYSAAAQNPVIVPAAVSATGTYSLIISGSGCTSPVATHSVFVRSLAQPAIITNDTLCQGSQLVIQAQSPDTGVTYSWTGPGNLVSSAPTITWDPADTIHTGLYTLQTSWANCTSATQSVYILVKPTPDPSITLLSGNCVGDSAQVNAQTMAGASSLWSGPAGFSSPNTGFTLYDLDSSEAGFYYYSSTLNGCTGYDSVELKANPLPYFSLGNDTTVCSNEPWTITPGTFATYAWSNLDTDSFFVVSNSGQVTLTVGNAYGCKYSDTVNVTIAQCTITGPNVFTPNGDGINDFFYFAFDHYLELKFIIYDRWGVKVYENSNNENKWDGMNMYSGKPCTEGTYYYIAESKNLKGAIGSTHGYLTLIR